MARTPLARAVQDAAAAADADSRRTTRARPSSRRQASRRSGLTALGRFAALRTRRPADRGSSSSARDSPGSRAPIACARPDTASTLHEASDRIGGRCWTLRGAFADGQIAEHGGELIDTGHDRDPADSRTSSASSWTTCLQAEQNGTELLGYFDGRPVHVQADDGGHQGRVADARPRTSPTASYPTTLRQLDASAGASSTTMSIVDWIDETIAGGDVARASGSCSTSPTTIEYGADSSRSRARSTCSTCSATRGQGQASGSSASPTRRYHVAGGNDQITDRTRGRARAARSRTSSELVAVTATLQRRVLARLPRSTAGRGR